MVDTRRILFVLLISMLSCAPVLGVCRSVRTFGAIGDGKHDDRAALQKALDSADCVTFPAGIYLVASYRSELVHDGNYALELRSNDDLEGSEGATILFADGLVTDSKALRGANLFDSVGQTNITVHNIMIDMNGMKNLVPKGRILTAYTFFFEDSRHVKLDHVSIVNSSGRNMVVVHGGTDLRISNGTFRNGGTSLSGNQQDDFSAIYLQCDTCSAVHNVIGNDRLPFGYSGGVELHGPNTAATDNTFQYASPAVYLQTSDMTMGAAHLDVLRNTMSKCNSGVVIVGPGRLSEVHIEDNVISTIHFPGLESNSFAIEQVHNQQESAAADPTLNNSTISGNRLTDLDPTQTTGRTFFLALNSAKNITISGNTIGAVSGMPFLFQSSAAGLRSISVSGNTIRDFGTNSGPYGHYAFYFDLKPSPDSGGKPGFVQGMGIANNTISLNRPTPHHALIAGEWKQGAISGLEMTNNSMVNIEHRVVGEHAQELENLVH